MNDQADMETQVLASLREIKQRYDALKKHTIALNEMAHTDPGYQKQMDLVLSEREGIGILHVQSRQLHDHYIDTQEHASATVRQLTSEITDLIRDLVLTFNDLEKDIRASQEQLRPQVNEHLKALQMKSAYQRRAV